MEWTARLPLFFPPKSFQPKNIRSSIEFLFRHRAANAATALAQSSLADSFRKMPGSIFAQGSARELGGRILPARIAAGTCGSERWLARRPCGNDFA